MSFNDLMRSFLVDLADVFPEDPAIQTSLQTFEDLVKANFRKPAAMFFEAIAPHAAKIAKMDESVFADMNFPGIDFKKLWDSDISSGTKNAIFSYLQSLLVLSVA